MLSAAVMTSSLAATDTDTDVGPERPGRRHSSSTNGSGPGGIGPRGRGLRIRTDRRPAAYQRRSRAHGRAAALRSTQVSDENGIIATSSERHREHPTAYDVGLARQQSPFVATRDSAGDVSFAIVTLVGDENEAEHTVDAVIDTVQRASEADQFDIAIGGDASIASESTRVVEEDFARALQLNLPITLLLLRCVQGARGASSHLGSR
jgi:hypothetical protein